MLSEAKHLLFSGDLANKSRFFSPAKDAGLQNDNLWIFSQLPAGMFLVTSPMLQIFRRFATDPGRIKTVWECQLALEPRSPRAFSQHSIQVQKIRNQTPKFFSEDIR